MSEMMELMEKLRKEIREGGELKDLPCPMCQKPRSQRSDYLRCSPCGVNWLQGEDITRHPLVSREPYLSSAKNRDTSSSKTEMAGSV